MMKIILTSFILLLISCSENISVEAESMGDNAEIEKIEIEDFGSFEIHHFENGKLSQIECLDSSRILKSRNIYIYDKKNRPQTVIELDNENDTLNILKWYYKDNVSNMKILVENEISIEYYFIKDEFDNTKTQYAYTKNGYLLDSLKNEYDKNQRRIKQTDFLTNQYYKYHYDKQGEMIQQDLYESDSLVTTRKYIYEYDSLKNWIKEITVDNNKDTSRTRIRKIKYKKTKPNKT